MANQSIYSEKWIDLVFENRNKEYGAYQLRQENPKTTLKALGIGFLLITFLVSVPMFINTHDSKPVVTIDNGPIVTPLEFKKVVFPPEKKPKTQTIIPLKKTETEQLEAKIKKEDLIDPKITEKENAKADVNFDQKMHPMNTKPVDEGVLGSENGGVAGETGTLGEVNPNKTNGTDNKTHISAILDKQPTFPGGINKFYNYIAQNFKTPDTELSNSIKVHVSFVIEKDGTMTDIQVLGKPEFNLDQEAIRVLKSLKTRWTPGILNGKPIRTSYNLPIIIKQQ